METLIKSWLEKEGEVLGRIRECTRLYLERFDEEDKDLMVCMRLLRSCPDLSAASLEVVCKSHCQRWTYPF